MILIAPWRLGAVRMQSWRDFPQQVLRRLLYQTASQDDVCRRWKDLFSLMGRMKGRHRCTANPPEANKASLRFSPQAYKPFHYLCILTHREVTSLLPSWCHQQEYVTTEAAALEDAGVRCGGACSVDSDSIWSLLVRKRVTQRRLKPSHTIPALFIKHLKQPPGPKVVYREKWNYMKAVHK